MDQIHWLESQIKQLQEKRVYLHEIEEDQRDEMESRTD
jgi:hypothetical protein